MKQKGTPIDGIRLSPRVFLRDGIFYLAVVAAFLLVAFSGHFTPLYAWLFLGGYALYVGMLYVDTKRHRNELDSGDDEHDEGMGLGAATVWLLVCISALGVACFFLVEETIEISHVLGVNPYVVAVILTAAATSIPDTIISVTAAKKGGEDAEEAIVNAFSSNIFDILICLSVPVLIYGSAIEIAVGESAVSLVMLAVTTVITLILCKTGNTVTRTEAWILVGMYGVFLASVIFNEQIINLLGLRDALGLPPLAG